MTRVRFPGSAFLHRLLLNPSFSGHFLHSGFEALRDFLCVFRVFRFKAKIFFPFGPSPARNRFFSLSLVVFRAFGFSENSLRDGIPYGTESLTGGSLLQLTLCVSVYLVIPLFLDVKLLQVFLHHSSVVVFGRLIFGKLLTPTLRNAKDFLSLRIFPGFSVSKQNIFRFRPPPACRLLNILRLVVFKAFDFLSKFLPSEPPAAFCDLDCVSYGSYVAFYTMSRFLFLQVPLQSKTLLDSVVPGAFFFFVCSSVFIKSPSVKVMQAVTDVDRYDHSSLRSAKIPT